MNKLSEKEISAYLKAEAFKNNITIFENIDSTNNYLKALSQRRDNSVVIAASQNAGRGRRGRTFYSPEGGLYMSLLINKNDIFDSDLITTLAAVSVARAIEKVAPLEAKIKWVNDIFINGKKVCGILAEGLLEESELKHIILGIGVNIHKMEFPDELKEIATSLSNEANEDISINHLAAEILNELQIELKNMSTLQFLEESRSRSNILGKEITVIKGEESYQAKALEINNKGNLIIDRNGKLETLFSGEVSIKPNKKA